MDQSWGGKTKLRNTQYKKVAMPLQLVGT